MWGLLGPNNRKGKKKSILGGHIGGQVGAYWAPLALCWIILGVFFINVLPGTLMGGDLAPKLGYLGLKNVCFLCNCRQNQHVGEIRRRSTFCHFWGGILEVFGSLGSSFGVSWGGYWLLLQGVGFGVRFDGIFALGGQEV